MSIAPRGTADGTVTRSRPLCKYPEVAKYGKGCTEDAELRLRGALTPG